MLRRLAVAILALAGVVSAKSPMDIMKRHAELAKGAQFETRDELKPRAGQTTPKSKYYNSNTASISSHTNFFYPMLFCLVN
ncbi:hypothetical protein L873DRAFT_1808745 [Choiromyces venosus 120613-1]|uniref:Uncharacterized protein n=1 Tax=Choiromyces venosus 120613-1 TaxID=1336337 RepID=A0A3N4JLI0_9PEZI|nr:hypothetical protein L873DRAFT_1808745 [Choiromyces venosus 120613-1]